MVRCPLRILQIHLFLLVQMHQMLLRGVTPPSYSLGPSRTGLGESGIHRAAEKRSSRKLGACQCAFVAQRGVTPRPAYPVVLWGLPRSSSGGPPCSRSSSAAFWGDGSSSTQ